MSLLEEDDSSTIAKLRALAAEKKIDSLVLELKADSGRLAFRSAVPLAIQTKVTAETDAVTALIRDLRRSGVYVVAKLSVFRDAIVPQQVQTVGVKHASGVNWLDNNKIRWLDPYKEPARDYLLSLITEVAGFGVDEILLDHFSFPTQGSVASISYGDHQDAERGEALMSFAREVATRLKDSHVALSAVLETKTALDGEYPLSGQQLPAMASVFDRLYVDVSVVNTNETFAPVLTAVSAVFPEDKLPAALVPILTIPDGITIDTLQIALDAAGGQVGLGWVLENNSNHFEVLSQG
jgi:hypothetical protein